LTVALPQHFLYFFSEPHGHGSFRPTLEVWDATVFTKNRDRLLEAEVAKDFLALVVEQARGQGWASDEHFTVDGSLLEAWASAKSFQPKNSVEQHLNENFACFHRRGSFAVAAASGPRGNCGQQIRTRQEIWIREERLAHSEHSKSKCLCCVSEWSRNRTFGPCDSTTSSAAQTTLHARTRLPTNVRRLVRPLRTGRRKAFVSSSVWVVPREPKIVREEAF
jgi:hypothetical protein